MERNSREDSKREKGLGPSGVEACLALLSQFDSLGIRDIVLCPGGRNAPMIEALELSINHFEFKIHTFFDERAAGFYALGLARQKQTPIPLSVTSGTAASELYSALIEAHATNIPLIALTADRPRSHRGVGSPQSMEQVGLFKNFAPTVLDWEDGVDFPTDWYLKWNQRSPIHINLCHHEPLWKKEKISMLKRESFKISNSWTEISASIPSFKKPLVILGSLDSDEVDCVREFCLWYKAPVLAEASSHLRVLSADERNIKLEDFDGIIRLGGVPSWRLWRDLEFSSLEVLSFGRTLWSGLPKAQLFSGELKGFLKSWMKSSPINSTDIPKLTHNLYELYPESEASWMRKISESIKENDLVYLGNSRPVRDWNEHSQIHKNISYYESRGLNGIDGQISTFLGLARKGTNWAILGDLTTLYDMQGPWAIKHLKSDVKTRIVVINNSGGKIFDPMFPSKLFLNEHQLNFKKFAEFWGLTYSTELKTDAQHALIEITPDYIQTQNFRHKWSKL
jgi:2-succinyl-5-enolpyruvyl-6-hydroxy-3-cyclohexene-1-carboxylate synthase